MYDNDVHKFAICEEYTVNGIQAALSLDKCPYNLGTVLLYLAEQTHDHICRIVIRLKQAQLMNSK